MPVSVKYGIIGSRWQKMTETVVLGESGRIVLPASIRNEFGLKTGDRLTLIAKDGRIEILSMKMAIQELRASIVAERGSLEGILDEFLTEKHEEARRELSEPQHA
jgi:AbrB family looped-hinge helix DNA binding protein